MEALQQRLEESFLLVTKYVGEIKTRRTEWRTHKGRMEETIRWVGGLLDDTEMKLQRVLRGLREGSGSEDGSEEEGDSSEDSMCIFISDKKETDWIASVMKLCVVEGRGVVGLVELETVLAEARKTSCDTARSHILKMVRPEFIEKRGAKKVIIGLKMR
jgi:hypothetical protein